VTAPDAEAFRRLAESRPVWTRVLPAAEAVPVVDEGTLLHAGPPLEGSIPPLLATSLATALVFEGRAATHAEALELLPEMRLLSANDAGAVIPLAGVISSSMPVIVVETDGLEAYSPLNEGGGCVLRFGCTRDGAVAELRQMRDEIAPLIDRVLVASGGVDVFELVAAALQMGDDCHHRFRALQLHVSLALGDRAAELPAAERRAVADAVRGNDFFPLNVVMACAKAACRSAEGVPGSSLLTAAGRNGRDAGVQVSGLPGRWFTAPVEPAELYPLDAEAAAAAEPDTGDSCVVELNGLGACALPAAPALARFFGGTQQSLAAVEEEMRLITEDDHPLFVVPASGFRGTPTGFSASKAVELRIAPATETLRVALDRHPHAAAVGLCRLPLAALDAAASAL
jgi:hypothetical protein